MFSIQFQGEFIKISHENMQSNAYEIQEKQKLWLAFAP